MAVVRARSAPPYALISFVILWVISTVLAVLFYVQWNGTQKELVTSQKLSKSTATPDEQIKFGADLLATSSDKSLTAMGNAKSQIETMKALITGDKSMAFDSVASLAKGALKNAKRPENEALNAALTSVAIDRDTKAKSLAELNAELDGLNAKIAAANSQTTQSFGTLQKENDDLRAQLAKANETATATATDRDTHVKSDQDQLNAAVVKAEAERRDLVLQIEQMKGELTTKDQIIKDLRTAMAMTKKGDNANVGEADGRIVRVNAANGEAYINLPSTDRIVPGLTFSVYDARAGVRFGTPDEAMGKGSIEVIEPGPVTSLCRITRTTPGSSVQAGDLIANPVYHHDRNRKFQFVVTGEFDLDGDGVATAAERERLTRLIASWGGEVTDKVTSQTDYLVAGKAPSTPSVITSEETPTTGSAVDQRAKLKEQYDSLIVDAGRLNIPVLNANRFLSMIGYYSTTIVRY